MAEASRSASTLARLRSTAATRITDGLLSSSGKVAGIGLATALVTLAFTIWLRIELAEQAAYRGPLSRAAAAMVGHGFSALRALESRGLGYAESRDRRRRAVPDFCQFQPFGIVRGGGWGLCRSVAGPWR